MQYTQNCKTGNNFSYPSPEDIEIYFKKVKKGLIEPTIRQCPVCSTPSKHFKRHDARKRLFYVPVKQIIQSVSCLLVRWRCLGCAKRILQYPDFALPYKRYTLQTALEYSAKYVENDQSSYQSVTLRDSIGYQQDPDDFRRLNRSTVWRWVATFGQMKNLSQTAYRLMLEADPASFISRHLAFLSVPAGKYVSCARKNLLIQCRKLLYLEAAYKNLLGTSLFPNLATTSGFS